ncbi:hypothetical protein [Marinomonas transparens]|uniref:Uncharacterized protein n=1 Tax=Marinomonas transparens TaxID=2795388 RepID=A0A934JP52_9GAMM|nr:hypothetical protein [Marinomonas transparens]MBJ7537168.1 hypothetical protein [Marinomonas transparens]
MIERIRYTGVELKKASFVKFEVDSEGGTIGLEATPDLIVITSSELDGTTFFSIPVEAKIWGEDKGTGDKVFLCEALLDVDFACTKDDANEEILNELVVSKEWYFRNYIALSVKTSLESILSNTAYDGIEIPLE